MAAPKRRVFRYAGFAGYLLQLAPHSFSWRRWVWCHYLPWAESFAPFRFGRWVRFGLTRPDDWWRCQRISLHVYFGFPMPKPRGSVLRA